MNRGHERRTYTTRNPDPEVPEQVPPPPRKQSTWAKTALLVMGSAILGGIATEIFRRHIWEFRRNKAPDRGADDTMPSSPVHQVNGPGLMAVPMPMLSSPYPPPMMPYGYGMPTLPGPMIQNSTPPPAPLSEKAQIEIARLEATAAKERREQAWLEAYLSGDEGVD